MLTARVGPSVMSVSQSINSVSQSVSQSINSVSHTNSCSHLCSSRPHRSIGDLIYKEPCPLLIARPEVRATPLQPGTDEFVIYASDGVWCALSNREAVEAVAEALRGPAAREADGGAAAAARALVQLAQARGSHDDTTAVVSVFQWGASTLSPAA